MDGHYLVRAPRPEDNVHITVSLHRDNAPPFVATLRGTRLAATVGEVARLQFVSPLAPLMVALRIRVQAIGLWLRGIRVVPR